MSPFLGVIKVEAVTREWVVLVSPAANKAGRRLKNNEQTCLMISGLNG